MNAWETQTSSCGQYIYIWSKLKDGQIVIKAEAEGFVVDIFNNQDESIATTCATYEELEGGE